MKPLENVRVLALENYYAGNIGSLYFARFGAEVIKLENPTGGDNLRDVGPNVKVDGRKRCVSEIRTMGGKASVAIDLQNPDGREAFWRLAEQVDVVWTNMKPSSLLKLGIDFDTLKARNPEVIYTSLSGFGHDDLTPKGPFGDWTAFDLIAQGLAGLQYRASSPKDDEPGVNGLPLGDQVTAMMAVLGTVMALYRRQIEGGPQRVDVAMHDTMMMLNELPLGLLAFTGREPTRGRSGTSAPYGAYRTRDGFINIAVGGNPIWQRLCLAIERPDLAKDERFASSAGRVQHLDELDIVLTAWTGSRTSMEIADILSRHTVPCAPVFKLPEVIASPQAAARNMLVTVEDPIAGPVRIVGNPVKMSGVDDGYAPPPPDLAADTRRLLRELAGYDHAAIDALAQSGAIGLLADETHPQATSAA